MKVCFFYFTQLYQLKKILVRVSQCYALDARALSFLRISIALVIIADLCIRGTDLAAFYTDSGIWPTRVLYNFGWKPGYWSLHALSGSYAWALALFTLHFIAACCLLVGYRTKAATLLVLLLAISMHNRNLYIQQAGDDLLRLILFWGLFLPWNSCYALDAKRKQVSAKQKPLANLGYLLMLASVYIFTVSLKTSAEWHGEGSAVYYALSLEQMRLPMGDLLYGFPWLMKWFTWLVFYTELLIPVLIIYPSKKGKLRFIAFLMIVMLHTGIGLTLYVGLFFVINMVAGLALLPGSLLDKAGLRSALSIKTIRIKKHIFKWVGNSICIAVMIACMVINLSAINSFDYELRKEVVYAANALRLDQYWGMFSPYVLKKDGWFVYHGIDSLGRQWDLRRNEDYVDYTKPAHIVSMYHSDRWRKLAENLQNDNFTFLRPLYGKYVLHKWNKEHPEKKIAILNLYFMEKENLPGYKTTPVTKKLYCVSDDN